MTGRDPLHGRGTAPTTAPTTAGTPTCDNAPTLAAWARGAVPTQHLRNPSIGALR